MGSFSLIAAVLLGSGLGFALGVLWARKNHFQDQEVKAAAQRTEIDRLQKQFSEQFENLANRIFDTKTTQFRETSERNLDQLLSPLRDRLKDFQKKVEDAYQQESRERFALKEELNRIIEANRKMTLEAHHLTQALRGDVKAQGNWGELILERVLEASGLRSGEEYILQGESLGLKSEDGRAQRPDVIIRLPEQKHLIVDSKVSLTHYERYVSETDEPQKAAHLKAFMNSLHEHVSGLSGKRYQDLTGLSAPDFVMMFVPIEGAFSLALQSDERLFTTAWEKTVVIVSPTTLLATLRTVSSIWKQERQTKNALEIARRGGLLYDKFVRFVETLDDVGDKLKGAQRSYDEAIDHLKTGRGNLIAQTEQLQKLGAKATKKLPPQFQQTELQADDLSSEA